MTIIHCFLIIFLVSTFWRFFSGTQKLKQTLISPFCVCSFSCVYDRHNMRRERVGIAKLVFVLVIIVVVVFMLKAVVLVKHEHILIKNCFCFLRLKRSPRRGTHRKAFCRRSGMRPRPPHRHLARQQSSLGRLLWLRRGLFPVAVAF